MSKPSLSIIITAYNEEASIQACLESLVAQTQNSFMLCEIIVISDGSTDQTVSVAKNVNNNLIRVIKHNENKGMQERLNEGFREAQGDYLFKIDADLTLFKKTSLEEIMNSALQSQVDGIIMFREYEKPQNVIQRYLFFWDAFRKSVLSHLPESFLIDRVTGSYLLSREIYQKISIPNNVIEEDRYTLLHVLSQDKKATHLDSPLVCGNYLKSWEHIVRQRARYSTSTITPKHFSKDFLKIHQPPIPKWAIFTALFRHLLAKPQDTLYLFIRIWVNRRASALKKESPIQRTW